MKYQLENSTQKYNFDSHIHKNYSFYTHFHKDYEIIYLLDGEITLYLSSDKTEHLKKGDTAFIFSNEIHSFFTTSTYTAWIGVFSSDYVKSFHQAFMNKSGETAKFKCSKEAQDYIFPFLQNVDSSTDFFQLKARITAICAEYMDKVKLHENCATQNDIYHEIIKYIMDNINNEISLKSLSEHFGYEPHYLSRVFHSIFKTDIRQYVNTLRIDNVKYLLCETDLPIHKIAFDCGFESFSTFNRVFKTFMGCSPSEYRNKPCDQPQTTVNLTAFTST